MNVRIFTDGACSRNGKKGARGSWAYWIPEHKHLSAADFIPENELQTNQRGELTAIFKAVECCKKSFDISQVDLVIYTDSMYSKNCLTTWLPNWIRKDWKNTQGCEVSHRDLIEQLATDLSKFKSYTINHIQAHTGNDDELSKHNEVVDQMATGVLNPSTEVKIVSNKEEFEDLPLKLMGPPMNEKT
jgi:ribonuclease HI